jgi:hypothetical protein
MSYVALGSAAISAVGAYENNQASKNGKAQPVNVSKAISDAQTQAANDLQNSINLENQFLPGQAALRANSNALNNSVATGNTYSQQMQQSLLSQGSGVTSASLSAYLNNPLTTAANSSILQSLNQAQAGQLPTGVQAQAAQTALQQGGAAGISGSGAGRGLTARDLGLTQLQYLQSAQGAASAQGNAYGALGLQQQGLQLQAYLGQLGGVQSAIGLQNQYALGLGNLMNATALPNSGLSGSQVASLDVGNTNIINGANQQQAANQASTNNAYAGIASGLLGNSNVTSGLAGLFSSSGGGGAASSFVYGGD